MQTDDQRKPWTKGIPIPVLLCALIIIGIPLAIVKGAWEMLTEGWLDEWNYLWTLWKG